MAKIREATSKRTDIVSIIGWALIFVSIVTILLFGE